MVWGSLGLRASMCANLTSALMCLYVETSENLLKASWPALGGIYAILEGTRNALLILPCNPESESESHVGSLRRT